MSQRKCRWAMWSLGRIAKRVIKEMKRAEGYEIAAICSSSLEKAQQFIDDNGLTEATAYTDITEILKREDIDIVYIASPPWLHVEQACQVMNAGKACLVEKPMVSNTEEARTIFECAKKNNVLCVEGVWTNYFPAMLKAKEWIQEGRIGDVVEVIATFGCPIETFGNSLDNTKHWGNNLSTGGGTLAQFGCYTVNLAQFIFDQLPEEIFGKSQMLPREDGSDINTFCILSYEGGAKHAMLSCSWMARTQSVARISGTKGEILLGNPFFAPYHAQLLTHQNHLWYNDVEETFDDPYEAEGFEGFKYQFDAVSKYVMEGKTESPDVSPKHSLELAETLERLRKVIGHIKE